MALVPVMPLVLRLVQAMLKDTGQIHTDPLGIAERKSGCRSNSARNRCVFSAMGMAGPQQADETIDSSQAWLLQ